MTATGATGTPDTSKRIVDTAGLNEGGESGYKYNKARRAGWCACLTR